MQRPAVLLLVLALLLAAALQAWVEHAKTRPPAARADHCTSCHAQVEGLEASHASLSCAACHLGNPNTRDEGLAHVGLIALPGQLADADRTCGTAGCHVDVPSRLRANIMTTMNGVVSVDRWVFGEQPTPTARTPVSTLGHTPADSHLRNLCASCHLGAPKAEAGPLSERTRGGGCLACHVSYSPAARASLGHDSSQRFVHAALTVKPPPMACFGCHARSGRVSLNYEGWREDEAGERTLADGRRLARTTPDVHAEAGLTCIDCHGSWEVMGDGREALHREDQSTLSCTDCHLEGPARTKAFAELDPESQRIATREGFAVSGRQYLTQQKGGAPLVNTFVEDGGAFLTGKHSGRTARLKPPAAACRRGTAHDALSCGSCHEAWVPQCVTCHTRFEPEARMFDLLAQREAPGSWEEEGGPALAEPAPLGVRVLDGGARRIEEFAPGMILTLSRPEPVEGSSTAGLPEPVEGRPHVGTSSTAGLPEPVEGRPHEGTSSTAGLPEPVEGRPHEGTASGPSSTSSDRPGAPRARFRRLFAPVFAHTVRREARSCTSCHADPLALGYGRGTLTFDGGVTFTARMSAHPADGLPQDAWIGFLATRGPDSTTREDTRPFTLAEQRRILAVGACLQCHPGDSAPMQLALDDLPQALRRRTARCR